MRDRTPLGLGAFPGPGHVSFAVWAPEARRVDVVLPADGGRRLTLEPDGDGIHRLVAAGLGPGTEYAFSLDGGPPRPDPCSRRQARGVHGPSVVVAPPPRDDLAEGWRGVRLDDLVFYEVHVGTATAEGTFAALERQLPRIRDLGITALELMPVAEWAGPRGWGYDGVLLYCPHAAYGGYGALRRLVAAAHRAGLAVFLDVVYNHFGPEGNYLPEFGPYLDPARKTPWGAAVNFDGPGSAGVRRHVVDNARYWIAEHGIDGLRLDAIHGIVDGSPVHVVAEIAAAVQELGPQLGREVHVVAESDLNDVKVVSPRGEGGWGCDAQWNDDFRHALHACLTGERQGILADFGRFEQLARAMREGFAFQGDYSVFRGDRHGTDSRRIPPRRFVVFCQNHDQVGNRPRGERLASLVPPEALPLAAGLAILSPYLPLLFMGEERGEVRPFLFFTSFPDEDLGRAVRAGRTADCRALGFDDEVPDPQDEATFRASVLDPPAGEVAGAALAETYRRLLELRREHPALRCLDRGMAHEMRPGAIDVLVVHRRAPDGGPDAVVVASLEGERTPLALPLPDGRWTALLDCAAEGARLPQELVPHSKVTLAPYHFAVLRRA
ncbi:malto-oligosyltrehalose trehalohydrolase [Myxococcota bacterium]|nr:malto-oligosyltrehalose trehalohydrolase [Myxococcota bacterium]